MNPYHVNGDTDPATPSIQASLAALQATTADFRTSMAALQASMTAQQSSMIALQASMAAQQSSMAAQQAATNALGTQLYAVGIKVEEVKMSSVAAYRNQIIATSNASNRDGTLLPLYNLQTISPISTPFPQTTVEAEALTAQSCVELGRQLDFNFTAEYDLARMKAMLFKMIGVPS